MKLGCILLCSYVEPCPSGTVTGSEVKGALDKYNIIPQIFQKKLGFLYH